MKLDAFQRQLFVAQPHHQAVIGLCRYLQAFRQGCPFHHQRMISSGLKGIAHPLINRPAVMIDGAALAVKQLRGRHHLPTHGLADGLQAQTNTQDRALVAEIGNGRQGHARLVRIAGAGRD